MNDYQEWTETTARYGIAVQKSLNLPPDELGALLDILYCTTGLAGEAGEVANKVKKIIRDDEGRLTRTARIAVVYELGDVLWYLARLARHMGYTLDEVARFNRDKLEARVLEDKIKGSGDNR